MVDMTITGYAVVDGEGSILINTIAQTRKTAMISWLRVYGRMRVMDDDPEETVEHWFDHRRHGCTVQHVRVEITHPKAN